MRTRRKADPQRSLLEGMVNLDVRTLWEPWMLEADHVLKDEEIIEVAYQAQGERHEHSVRLGRGQTAAEIVLRLLVLKHVRKLEL